MKKLLSIIFVFMLWISSISAYNLNNKDLSRLSNFELQVAKIFENDISKAYNFQKNINILLPKYKDNTKNKAILNYLNQFTNNTIKSYEQKILEKIRLEEEKRLEELKQKEKDEKIKAEIIDLEKQYINKLPVLNRETQTISTFTIEPRFDHIYLKNIYLKNIGTVSDMTNIFEKLYLVSDENAIFAEWYVIWDYLYFDITWDLVLDKNKLKIFYIKATFKEITNQSQTWELKFELSTPNNWLIWTLNGIRATSYSNGSYISSEVKITNPIITFLSYTSSIISTQNDFKSSYSNLLEFRVNNSWNRRLDLDSFEFKIYWSFLNSIDQDSEIVLKIKWSNQEFWRVKISDIENSSLIIKHSWDAYNFISQNSYTDYRLEINHIWNPSWFREVRLFNVVIWDGFGWLINNLNDYSNTGLPANVDYYRY